MAAVIGTDRTTLPEVLDAFLAVEREHAAWAYRVGDVAVWDHVRVDVFDGLVNALGLLGARQGSAVTRPSLRGRFRSYTRHNPLLMARSDVVFVGHPRRKREPDGAWWDIYCDPVIDALHVPSLLLEASFRGEHREPAHTKAIAHLDTLTAAAAIRRRFRPSRFAAGELAPLRAIAADLAARTGVTIDIAALAHTRLARRASLWPLFRTTLERLRPELVVVVCSYGNEVLIEACQSVGVTTAELQHGLMSPYHVGYHYPGDATKAAFPDWFLAFGDAWLDTVALPIPRDRQVPIGYAYFERCRERVGCVERGDRIVALSAPSIGVKLSKAIAEAAVLAPDLAFAFKPHPEETADWRERYPWLDASPVEVIDAPGADLYELLASARAQVAVYSTALVEGIGLGTPAIVLEQPGSEMMRPVLRDVDGVGWAADAAGLVDAVRTARAPSAASLERLFVPHALANAKRVIEDLAGRG